uniref:Mutator-like transposase domain-containing protein n=1 Tax=Timema bartmani TaxID=61472 RepID=A0A7R9I533_9NEOP|nr:unnamed protein product [Timema bartmani]
MEEMKMAAQEESRLAVQEGAVDVDGVPLITVVADGSWATCSYRSNFSSLSGMGLGGCATPNPLSPSKCHSCYLVTVGKILLTEKLPMALAENNTQDHQASSQVRRPLHYENDELLRPRQCQVRAVPWERVVYPTSLDCAVDSLELQPAGRLQAQSSPTIHSRWQVEGVVSHCSVVMLSIAVIWWTCEGRVQNTGGGEGREGEVGGPQGQRNWLLVGCTERQVHHLSSGMGNLRLLSQDTSVQNMLKAARNRVFNFKGHEAAFPFDHRTIFTVHPTGSEYRSPCPRLKLGIDIARHLRDVETRWPREQRDRCRAREWLARPNALSVKWDAQRALSVSRSVARDARARDMDNKELRNLTETERIARLPRDLPLNVVALADVLRLLLGGPTLVDELLRRRRAVHIRLDIFAYPKLNTTVLDYPVLDYPCGATPPAPDATTFSPWTLRTVCCGFQYMLALSTYVISHARVVIVIIVIIIIIIIIIIITVSKKVVTIVSKWMTSRPVLQKDIKLIASVLALEHYTFLITGVFIANPSLFLPYLMMQAFMVLVQGVVFIILVIDCGIHLSRMELLYSVSMVHSLVQAFCLFRAYLSYCDL